MKHILFKISGIVFLLAIAVVITAMPSHAANTNYKYYYDIDFFLNGHSLHVLPGSEGTIVYTSTWWDNHGLKIGLNGNDPNSWNYIEADTYRRCGVTNGACDADRTWNIKYSDGFYIQDYNLWTNYFEYVNPPRCFASNCRYHPYGVEVKFYSNTYYPFSRSGVNNYYQGIAYHVKEMNVPSSVPANSCADSDGGVNYYVKGTVKGILNGHSYSYSDSCSGKTLTEYFCKNNIEKESLHNCVSGCSNGACIKLTNSCADSDGGVNYYVKGTVKGILNGHSYSYSDSCSGKTLTEYFCKNNIEKESLHNCVSGCSNGACIGSNVCQMNGYQCGILKLNDGSVVNCGDCSGSVCRLGKCVGGTPINYNSSSGDWEVGNNPLRARNSQVTISGKVYSMAKGGTKSSVDKALIVAVPKYNYYPELSQLNSINRPLIVKLYYLKNAGYDSFVSTALNQYALKKGISINTLKSEFNSFSEKYKSGTFSDSNKLIGNVAPHFDKEHTTSPGNSMCNSCNNHPILGGGIKMSERSDFSLVSMNDSDFESYLASDISLPLPLPHSGQYFIGYSNSNGDYSVVVNNGWDYTLYAIANIAGTTIQGSKDVNTALGNTNTVNADVPMYGPDCTDQCGVDAFGQCNPLCYNSTTVASCKNIDPSILNALVNNCIPASDNTKEFVALDSNGVKHSLTCCNHVSPYVTSVSASNINLSNSSNVDVISKNVYYKDLPAIIKMIITS